MPTQTLTALGRVPASVSNLDLEIKGAIVNIVHQYRDDIALNANNPGNWTVNDGAVRQTKVQKPLSGGSNVVMSSVNGSFISTGRARTVIQAGGRNVSIINGEVFIDGKRVSDSEEPADQPSSGDPDRLEVIVPYSYVGGLTLSYADGSKVDLDCWKGGHVSLSSDGGDDLKAGQLCALSSFVLQSTGAGDLTFEKIQSDSFVATKTGSGDLDIDELSTGALLLTQTGSGDTSVDSGSATSGSVTSTGSGDVKMRGSFEKLSKRSVGSGEIKIRSRQ